MQHVASCHLEFPKSTQEAVSLNLNIYIFLESGEAGSKCDYGYEDKDGLCKYTGATTSTVAPSTVTAPKVPTAAISFPNQNVLENSENDVPNEPSSSYSIFSMVHILVVLGFGYSIFT
ncbi:hypothetical protein B9Z55_007949 [Caenorhabditis nigoni]|uniref:Uncharacterized protein n=1 Tax=Caenorhabditis nigoni TaxID=1611254 RepID=A0A2G5VBY9_9PELO|nr:hypothetical protein B9Z55_007949 [Caenorhabditis nigoni]